MIPSTPNKLLNFLIALVWLVNGLFCEVLNGVPRHQAIVASIPGDDHAILFTKLIVFAEIVMAMWIVSGYLARLTYDSLFFQYSSKLKD